MRDFWEWIGIAISFIAVSTLAIVGMILAAVAVLFWPSIAIIVVFIAGKAVGVW